MKYLLSIIFLLLVVILAMFNYSAKADEVNCLALNIYHEARNQPFNGKLAVGYVSKWWKEQYGKEVPLKNKCHFSWWCDGKSDEPTEKEVWELTKALAFQMYYEQFFTFDLTGGSTHYHADYVNPYWAKKKERVIQIKNHIFYK